MVRTCGDNDEEDSRYVPSFSTPKPVASADRRVRQEGETGRKRREGRKGRKRCGAVNLTARSGGVKIRERKKKTGSEG